MMDVIKLLEYLQEILDTSSKIPMTNKVMVDKEEVSDIIDQIVNYLPDEFKKAQWICEEKERILKDANEQAEMIKKESLDMIRKKINNHDYVKEANIKAEEIVSSAQRNAKTIKSGARDYAIELLLNLEQEIDSKHKAMLNNMKKDLESFMINVDGNMSNTTKILKQNIEELRSMK